MSDTDSEAIDQLIPELALWREHNGDWFGPREWISGAGSHSLAIGYSQVFWPDFVLVEDHVVRDVYTAADLEQWQAAGYDRASTEAVMNHLHLSDMHLAAATPTEAQLRYLGRVLKRIYEVKLAVDFPDRAFVVSFPDEPGLDPLRYEITFWQK